MKAKLNKLLLTMVISILFFTSLGFGAATAYLYYEGSKTTDELNEKDDEIHDLRLEIDEKDAEIQALKENLGEFKGKLSVLEEQALNTNPDSNNSGGSNTEEAKILTTDKVISRVQELSGIRPQGDPILAVIEDVTALKKEDPDFYADAKAGDYLVVFDNVKLIYRESLDKIINSVEL